MAKVTSKLQLTIPKAITDQYGIRPGDKLDWVPAGGAIRVALARPQRRQGKTIRERLTLFDQATERQRQREVTPVSAEPSVEPGWKPHTKASGAGEERISALVAALVDTSILVCRFDSSAPVKQKIARELLGGLHASYEFKSTSLAFSS